MSLTRRLMRSRKRRPDLYIATYSDTKELIDEIGDIPRLQILIIGAKDDLTEFRARKAAAEWKHSAASKQIERLMICVDGYDDDSRELWMIPEVCAYVCDFARYAGITLEQAIKFIPDECGAGLLAACGAFGDEIRQASLSDFEG